jgi:hypothetical protein
MALNRLAVASQTKRGRGLAADEIIPHLGLDYGEDEV